jgi:hypothetical protein
MGYFMNRTYCDSPLAIGSIKVSALDKVTLNLDAVYTDAVFVDYSGTDVTFDKNLDGFTLVGVQSCGRTIFTKWWTKQFLGLYLHTESMNRLLESKWKDSSEAILGAEDIMGEGLPLRIVTKTNGIFDLSVYLREIRISFFDSFQWFGPFVPAAVRKKISNDLDHLSCWSSGLPDTSLTKLDSLVVTKEADKSISIEFPGRPDLTGFKASNTYFSEWFLQPILGRECSILFKKPLNGEENASD